MPRRKVLNAQERAELLNVPDDPELLATYYTFSNDELGWIGRATSDVNRLGFAVQLALMRYPGVVVNSDWLPSAGLVRFAAEQIGVDAKIFAQYPIRDQTLWDHRAELQRLLRLRPYREHTDRLSALVCVDDLAVRTDHGATIVRALIENFRNWRVLLPSMAQLELLAGEAITRGERKVFAELTSTLTEKQREQLGQLLSRKRDGKYELTWLTESEEVPSFANILRHIERLLYLRTFRLHDSLREKIHEERLAKLADITSKSHLPGLRELNATRRAAALVPVILDFEPRIVDELLILHGKMIGRMHNDAKVKYEEKKLADAEALREGVLLLLTLHRILSKGRREKALPYDAIEKVISWDDFQRLVDDIRVRTKDERSGSLPFVLHAFNKIHRYAGPLLRVIEFHAASAVKPVWEAIEAVKRMHREAVDLNALPKTFVPLRWQPLVFSANGIDRKYYELCALTRLNECLRSGDMWVKRSHRFKDFEDYLISRAKYQSIKTADCLPVAINPNCDAYLESRLAALQSELTRVEALARNGLLEGVTLTDSRFRIAREERNTPIEAGALSNALYDLLPRVKITDMVQEVDSWVNFSRCFINEKTGQEPPDRLILHAALLAKGLNLGSEKMAQACPDERITRARLDPVDIWCLRPPAFTSAFGLLLEAQKRVPIAEYWGDATTSSSDGQRFRTTRHAYDSGSFNPKYGSEPGTSVYTHVSDLWAPIHATAIAGPAEEVAYVLDGLLYSDPTILIKEHYTDTAGFADHVFAFAHLFGFCFAARVRKFSEYTLHLPGNVQGIDALRPLVGEELNVDIIAQNWDEILRAATSIKHGTVRASVLMRKLSGYPRQNRLSLALREFGRIERSLFMLQWMSDPEFRRRVHRGLNKGEAVHALTSAVAAIGRAGEIRDRTLPQQIRRANGFNLLVGIISLWNTVYLDRALKHLTGTGSIPDRRLLAHMAPLGHDHITLTGDYIWPSSAPSANAAGERYRPLRVVA